MILTWVYHKILCPTEIFLFLSLKERQISTVQSSAEATTSTINTSLDYYNAGINTIGLVFNLRKELKDEISITADEWKYNKGKNKKRD